MAKSFPALINPEMLSWARSLMGLDLYYVAEKAGIGPEYLKQWEDGRSRPTISQLRKVAKLYRFSIAIFYLPQPPDINIPQPKDRRLLPGYE